MIYKFHKYILNHMGFMIFFNMCLFFIISDPLFRGQTRFFGKTKIITIFDCGMSTKKRRITQFSHSFCPLLLYISAEISGILVKT